MSSLAANNRPPLPGPVVGTHSVAAGFSLRGERRLKPAATEPTASVGWGISRRSFLQLGAAGLAALSVESSRGQAGGQEKPAEKGKPTRFPIACMTLPYGQFPLERALIGLKGAGYQYVAWGGSHKEADGQRVPIMPPE